jgi:mitochondrial import receptor subunit TOM40
MAYPISTPGTYEKPAAPSAFSPYLDAVANLFHPVAGPVQNTYNRFHGWKESMGLIQPGTVETLTREISRQSIIRDSVCVLVADGGTEVHLANWTFDGAKADVSKSVSANPLFHLTHSFSLGSTSRPASYNFGAVFANAQTLLQGGIDGSGVVTMRANQTWSPVDVTKVQGQVRARLDSALAGS